MKNSKKRVLFGLGRKIIFSLALFVLVFAAASIVKVQAADTIMGWLGGWSEDANISGSLNTWPPDGNETGVGWASMNNTNPEIPTKQTANPYNVTIDDTGKVSGYAWANASNTPNSTASQEENGLGWVDFNPQDHCTTGAPGVGQYKAASCTPPSGSAGVFRSGNNLTGWARLVGIAKESAIGNSGGWDGWVKMYNVSIDPASGQLAGFGWNGETSGSGNNIANGLGWINFNRAKIEKVCSIEFDPADGVTMNEGGENKSTKIKESLPNCDCGTVTLSSDNSSILDVNPTSADFSSTSGTNEQSLTLNAKSVSANQTAHINASSTKCANAAPMPVYIADIVSAKCTPSEQSAKPGQSATFNTSPNTPNVTWSVVSGGEYLESWTTSPDKSSATFVSKQDVSFKTVEVSAGSNVCKLNIGRLGWIETNP